MFLHKLAVITACGLAVAVVGNGLPVLFASAQAPPKPSPIPSGAVGVKPAEGKKPGAAAKPAGPGSLVVGREGDYWVMTPGGKIVAELAAPEGTESMSLACFSPDATRVALVVVKKGPLLPPRRADQPPEPVPYKVVIRTPEPADAGVAYDLPAHGLTLGWAADGKQLVVVKLTDPPPAKTFENLLLDPATGKTVPLGLPAGVRVLDCARDGKTFLVESFDPAAGTHTLGLAAAGNKEVRTLTGLGKSPTGHAVGRLSPDGTKVLFVDVDLRRKTVHTWMCQRPYLLDVATRKREPVPDFPENGRACGVAWSPDGKRIAYTWAQLHESLLNKDTISGNDTDIETEAFLMVADADGKNPRTVASDKGRFALNPILDAVDWR